MTQYILRRILAIVPTMLLITIVGFVIMELPPGDYVSSYMLREASSGNTGIFDQEESLRAQYGLDDPVYVRFGRWLLDFARGDFGQSFDLNRPVREVIAERIGMTVLVSLCAFVVSWGIGIPLGIYSATHQYSKGDNFLTTATFLGLGIPDFLLALVLLVLGWRLTGDVLTGLFSAEYMTAPWSFAKVLDLLRHLWISVAAVVVTGTAFVMRVMRGNMLNELGKNYIVTLRAKGIPERVIVYKHALRNALHPLVMSLGQTLAFLINGFTLTSIVLNLPTLQPVYLNATLQQDVYLGGTVLILIGFAVLMGTLVADILLAWLDPRVRFD